MSVNFNTTSYLYNGITAKTKKQEADQKEIGKKDVETSKTEKSDRVELSDRAKKLLEKLKKTYKNMDFIIADYADDEEAAAYLARGSKEYSVLMDPETLEEMAADEKTEQQYTGIIEEATGKLTELKENLGDQKEEVKHIGVSVDKDGNVSYFAELEELGEKQKERIEKAKENRKAEETKKEKAEVKKRTRVQASSVEELLDKIKNVDWSKIQEDSVQTRGSRFDYSV